MHRRDLEVLYEDNHLLAINKPAGLATMGVARGTPSAVDLARNYIKHRYDKPGNVYLGIVSRLDAGASGVLLVARTSKAAARLTEQFRSRAVKKTYLAIVSGTPEPSSGELVDWLAKSEAQQRMIVGRSDSPGAKEARLRYRQVGSAPGGSVLEVDLLTGRKHQIRLQLASRGHPIRGEKKYGRGLPFEPGIALHALRLELDHPVRHEPLAIEAPLPDPWRALGVGL